MKEDVEKGLIPCGVMLNLGTTNTCGYDPVDEYKQVVAEYKVWLHVDAAYAGPAMLLPAEITQEDGKVIRNHMGAFSTKKALLEVATSFNFNGSKWFLCGFDSAFLFCRDKELLIQAQSMTGDYMQQID